ncbi:hypothetical protein [Deinococcus rubellus]|uniref:Uncharacterized protein n=1 Tax=Deinococcus rubellus TaxID=1889240 RepID=A0ABY5YF89_9DEIO|nr:hypothetical protein [Deinococcus rubellus]UWX63737.1 hypothetical protein N0D28_13525 [Deinococcus rubellus]
MPLLLEHARSDPPGASGMSTWLPAALTYQHHRAQREMNRRP